ncbi:squalene/phytoene synthase family protein [Niveispirillum sp.]|uniref:squalene/phytoene synthase family protein n=1 Tax=Niveispirillum sp. TaxID=1917217 RepID=UPI001B609037|nr:squalene/phytoene synthase family protein [Niveispirillum sp.]MBP7336451.1 squalene/phytoene synthase family protein [Niveispirillum sp.]
MAEFRLSTQNPAQPGDPAARKGAAAENFPVASRLIPAPYRPHVMAFYAFARLADDIADDPHVEPDMKIAQLDALERALVSGIGNQPWLAPALTLKATQTATGVSGIHARQLLQAFRRDAMGSHCKTWQDLVLYCRYSANPVGRFLLELHGEGINAAPASDALCTALQILNHIQDCRHDWVELGRCYLPTAWFKEAGGSVEHLVETEATPPVRTVIDRTLDNVDSLLRRASALPRLIANPGLRMESAVIIEMAVALSRQLRRRDPLAGKVQLSAFSRLGAVLLGVLRGMSRRPPRLSPESVLAKAGSCGTSTFYWPLRLLGQRKRRAMFAIYGFCRAVDDIADGTENTEVKRGALTDWQRRIDAMYGMPSPGRHHGRLRDLASAVRRYSLPQAEFQAVIDGMMMDVDGPIRAPSLGMLAQYCRRVAGAVGLLSVRVFGKGDASADAFALALGEALQLTNILRDVEEDARDGRCYLPEEMLEDAGIDIYAVQSDPVSVLTDPALPQVCEALAARAEAAFDQANGLLKQPHRKLWPAAAMMVLYHRILVRLRQRGWSPDALSRRPRLGKWEKISVALSCALGRSPRL